MELYVSTLDLKLQVNLVEDYEGEDLLLNRLLAVAQLSVENHIQQPLENFVEDGNLNPMLVHAILILSAHFYANREPIAYVQPRPVPYTFEYLLQPFKKYT